MVALLGVLVDVQWWPVTGGRNYMNLKVFPPVSAVERVIVQCPNSGRQSRMRLGSAGHGSARTSSLCSVNASALPCWIALFVSMDMTTSLLIDTAGTTRVPIGSGFQRLGQKVSERQVIEHMCIMNMSNSIRDAIVCQYPVYKFVH